MSQRDHQQHAKTYALGFHGEYLRAKPTGNKVKGSDFFINYGNIKKMIIDPLKQTGTVLTYLDTVMSIDCPQRDEELLHVLQPVKYNLMESHSHWMIDSYVRVLNLIQEDLVRIDYYAILLRFDVQYNMPIDLLNISWDITNVAFRGYDAQWFKCGKASDLFFVLPKRHVKQFSSALQDSGEADYGSGHSVYRPFIEKMGEHSIDFIDYNYQGSSDIDDTKYDSEELRHLTFLFINRAVHARNLQCIPRLAQWQRPLLRVVGHQAHHQAHQIVLSNAPA